MFNRKKIKELENEIKEHKKEIEKLKFIIQTYKVGNDRLAEEIEDLRLKKTKKIVKDYDYAILINGNKVRVWNEDRFEEHISEVFFNYDANDNDIPKIEFKKIAVGKEVEY